MSARAPIAESVVGVRKHGAGLQFALRWSGTGEYSNQQLNTLLRLLMLQDDLWESGVSLEESRSPLTPVAALPRTNLTLASTRVRFVRMRLVCVFFAFSVRH
jgi:hypothetical protein